MQTNFSKYLFWDHDSKLLDEVNDYEFIINRVIDKGAFADIIELRSLYGDEIIKNVLHERPFLEKGIFYLLLIMLHDKKENYLCYTKNQFLMS